MDGVRQRRAFEEVLILLDEAFELFVAREIDLDVIRNLVAVLLAHRLHFADDLAHEAFFDEFRRKRRLERNRHAAITLAVVAFRLRHRDIDILRLERDIAVIEMENELARLVELFLRLVAVDGFERFLDGAHLFADLRAEHAELRLERIREVCFHVVLEDDLLDVELFLDDFLEEVRQHRLGLDVHRADRLAVLDVRVIARRAAEHDDGEHFAHVLFELGVDVRLIDLREVAEMDGLRRILVDAADEVAVDGFRHERNHRCRGLDRRDKRRVERHVGVDLVLLHALRPETAAAAADIPVREFVDELLERLGSFRHAIVREVVIDVFDHRVEAREAPFVHDGQLVIVERVFRRIEVVDVRIEHEERIRVPERAHELALAFLHGIVVEAVRQPRRAVLIEIPADGVCAMLAERLHRIDGVALRLRHLMAVLVLDMAEHDDVLVRGLVEQQRRNRNQRIEPAARLVDGLGDEIGWKALLEDILVLERIMPLRERHRAGIKPAIDDFRHAVHRLAALRALHRDLVDIRAMELDVVGAVVALFLELGNRADALLMAALALPDRQRRAPVTVARKTPVLHMLEPVAETAFAERLRNPVDRLVVRDELVLDRRHADEPRRTRVVEERRVAAPAMRIAMRELRRLEELALLLEVLEDHRVGLLDEDARPFRLLRELALAVDEVHERDIVFLADAVIVFTKSRCHVDDARAVFRRDIAIACHDERLLVRLLCNRCVCKRIERLVLAILEVFALVALNDFAVALDTIEDFVDECFGEDVVLAVHADFDVIDIRVHAEREVRRQRPRRRRPCEIIRIVVFRLERHHRRALRDVLVSLRDFVR